MIAGLFKRWREARAEAAAKRAHLQSLFESFLLETQPLVPRAPKHREAALYRHAWKRAAVLEVLHQRRSDQSRTSLFRGKQRGRESFLSGQGQLRLPTPFALATLALTFRWAARNNDDVYSCPQLRLGEGS